MLNQHDLYRFSEKIALSSFGQSIIQYDIRKYEDVRNLGNRRAYLLSCRQRIMIPNANPYQVGPCSSSSYEGYPAAITNKIALELKGGETIVELKRMFPQTLNASVDTTLSSQSGTSSSVTNQHTTGSHTSQSNTFGVSLSGGFFGELPVAQLALDYSHGWESGTSNSATNGMEAGHQALSMSGESMSVKDWSCYGALDDVVSPIWTWGQTYPWDVIQFNHSTDSSNIHLPSFVSVRLIDTTNDVLLPPSQLSLFGVDFTMKATWLIVFSNVITESEAIRLTHTTTCYTASHRLIQGTDTQPPTVSATLETDASASSAEIRSDWLELSTYALDPILNASANNGAVIGFSANPFTYAPNDGSSFKIVSPANNLQVTGAGFDANMTSNFTTPLSVSASLDVNFKIIDTITEYSLFLKHWIGPLSGVCKMTVKVNGNAPIVIYVDSAAGQGGQNNVTAIELRNTDFSNVNYHDYLAVGQNNIHIDIEPADKNVNTLYTLFALAIGTA
jgi:hypothetical protein